MSTRRNISLRGGHFDYDTVVEITDAEPAGTDWIVAQMDAAAVADAWAASGPVSRAWDATPDGSIVLVEHAEEGRPRITHWPKKGEDMFFLGHAPIDFVVREHVREISDADALDRLKRALIVPGVKLENLAEIVQLTGRAVG